MASASRIAPASEVATALAALREHFGDKLQTGEALRSQHGAIEGMTGGGIPDAVLFAENTDDVAAAVALCAQHRLPVIARGAGSSSLRSRAACRST